MGSSAKQVIGGKVHAPPVGIPAKKMMKKARFSSTPGKTKGIRPTPQDRIFAKRSRSYKLNGYADWCRRKDGVTSAAQTGRKGS